MCGTYGTSTSTLPCRIDDDYRLCILSALTVFKNLSEDGRRTDNLKTITQSPRRGFTRDKIEYGTVPYHTKPTNPYENYPNEAFENFPQKKLENLPDKRVHEACF
jgi:hypothetical protein